MQQRTNVLVLMPQKMVSNKLSMELLAYNSRKKILRISIMVIVALLCSVVGFNTYNYTVQLKNGYWLWDEGGALYSANATKEACESYAEAYPLLRYNGLFLVDYALALKKDKQNGKAIAMFEEAEKWVADERIYMNLGELHLQNQAYTKAYFYWMKCTNLVPVRFAPWYKMMQLAVSQNDSIKAIKYAQIIISKPIKVASPELDSMMSEAKRVLIKYEQ